MSDDLATKPITPSEFEEMCRRFDLTYTYSDDHRAYERGRKQYQELLTARRQLGDTLAVPIYNKVVSEKLTESFAPQFFWKEQT